MSQQNVELVGRLFAELVANFPLDDPESRLTDATLEEFFDPEVEWVPVQQSLLGGDSYRGYNGVRRFWIEFLSTWEEYVAEPEELFDRGNQVVATMRISGRTHDLAIKETWSALYTLRNGRILRSEAFTSRDGALEAAGLGTFGP